MCATTATVRDEEGSRVNTDAMLLRSERDAAKRYELLRAKHQTLHHQNARQKEELEAQRAELQMLEVFQDEREPIDELKLRVLLLEEENTRLQQQYRDEASAAVVAAAERERVAVTAATAAASKLVSSAGDHDALTHVRF